MRSGFGIRLFVLVIGVLLIPYMLPAVCLECDLAPVQATFSGAGEAGVGIGHILGPPGPQLSTEDQAQGPEAENSSLWAPLGMGDSDTANPGKPVASDDKRKVPKKRKSKKKGEEDDDKARDDDGSGSPFSDCLGDLFLSILCSGDDDDDVEMVREPELADVEPLEYEREPAYSVDGVEIPFSGVIVPTSPSIEIVNLWSAAGGVGSDGYVVSGLERGTGVQVMGLQYADQDQPWLWVKTAEPNEVTGWVHADYVVPEGLYEPPEIGDAQDEPAVSEAEPPEGLYEPSEIEYAQDEPAVSEGEPLEAYGGLGYPREPASWEIVGGVGWSPIESQLRGEFGWSGVGGRVAARFFPIPNLLLGLRAGYTQYWGDPEFDYEIYRDGRLVQKDIPVDTDLSLFDVEAQIGGRINRFGGGNTPWSMLFAVEAGVSRVEQRSPIEYEIYDQDGHITGGGRREDVMTKWRTVIGFSGEVDYTFATGFILGFHAGLKGIHWKPEEQESLILDWLDGEFISLFYCGLSLGYAVD